MSAQPATGGAAGRISRLFGLEGDRWMRHTNPVSVWSRFSVLALLALAIWSRDWIGWLCLVPVALALVWMMVNPLLVAYCGKLWFIDRMVLLFEDAKTRNPRYAAWEY